MKRFEFLSFILCLIVLACLPSTLRAEDWKSRADTPTSTTTALPPKGNAPEQKGPPIGPPPPIKGPWDLPVAPDSQVKIHKIYDFINDPKKTPIGKDKAIEYEFEYYNHGAITEEEKQKREGHYFTVNWINDGPPADFILRFDYRQAATKETVKTLEIPFPHASGSQKGTFSVTGEPYHQNGFISSWRISVVKNGKIIAQRQSFIW